MSRKNPLTPPGVRAAMHPRGFSYALAALVILPGCGGGSDNGDAEASTDNPEQSVVAAMLSEGGIANRPEAQEVPLEELGFDFGSAEAPIQVIEFSDYGCGYCRRFHTETFPTLRKDYIETGKVRWKYVTYVSGMFPNGLPAAFFAECAAEQGHFPSISDLLYERQADWKGESDPFPAFEELAREVGVDVDELGACIDEERPKGRVRSGVVSGRRLGIRGTPAFLANGVPLMGAQPLEWWVELFSAMEDVIEEAAAAERETSGQVPPP